MKRSDALCFLRVRYPSVGTPQGVTGWRPGVVEPSPPPCGWSTGFMAVPRVCGRTRHLGKRPHNRGVSMNPVDHPLGGGEGKTSGGRHPVSPWGQPTKGYKTRNRKSTDRFIVQRRPK